MQNSENADKASKSHVENEITKIPQQPQNVLLLDGSKAMRGDLDMGTKKYNKTRKSHLLQNRRPQYCST